MPPLLLILLIAWAALLFGGFIFGKPQAGREGTRCPPGRAWLRRRCWSWRAGAGPRWLSGSGAATFSLLIAVGMTLGFLGDLFMAKLLPVSPHVLWGMARSGWATSPTSPRSWATAAAHGLDAAGPRLGAWLAWLLIGAVAWYFVVFRGQKPTALHWAALPYSLLLASTAGFATGLALQDPAFVPLAIGAVLFLISDLILAAQLFAGRRFRLIDDVVWLTYGPGQMLIVYSVGAAIMAA